MITLMQFLALSGLDADVPTTKQSDSSRGACFKCFSTLTLNLKSLFLAQKFSGRLAPPWAQWLLYSPFFLGISFQKNCSCRAFSKVVRVTREKYSKTISRTRHISHRQSRIILLESQYNAIKAASSVSVLNQTRRALTLWSYLNNDLKQDSSLLIDEVFNPFYIWWHSGMTQTP